MKKIEEHPNVVDLLSRVKTEHDKKLKEAEEIKAETRQSIIEAMEAEETLKQKIKTARAQIEKIELEHDTIYEKQLQRSREEIKKQSVSKEDVKSGKSTLAQFQSGGKEEEEIAETARIQALGEMEKVSDIIRDKRMEILKDELELSNIRMKIYNLSTNPARIMLETYKSSLDWLQYEFDGIIMDGSTEKYLQKQKKHELALATTGVSIDGGQAWRNISVREARKLTHNPIMPKEHVSGLLEQLDNVGSESAMVTVTLVPVNHPFPGPPVTVRLER